MSTNDMMLLIVICGGFVLFVAGIAIWQRKSFYRRNLWEHPDGPDPERDEEAPFYDGDLVYRVTALPAREPVWLFRPDAGLLSPNAAAADNLVGAIVGFLVSAVVLWLVRTVVASSDQRWRVVVDRKDKPNVANFHAVSVEFFNSQAAAESRRNAIVRGWLPNWKYATAPRLSRKEIKAAREAAPAYVPDPDAVPKLPLSRRARVRRRLLATALGLVGVAFTLFWIVGGIDIADEGVRGSGTMVDYVATLVMCVVFVLISAAVVVSAWRLRPGRQ